MFHFYCVSGLVFALSCFSASKVRETNKTEWLNGGKVTIFWELKCSFVRSKETEGNEKLFFLSHQVL